MLTINKLFNILDKVAPIRLSEECVKLGDYDNSGIILNCHEEVKKILFPLDLSVESVKKAKSLKCDTIVTHHPAIYYPIKKLEISGENEEVMLALYYGLNVISMHLNLDTVKGGIDESLSEALGGKNSIILEDMQDGNGYGRVFEVNKTLKDFVKSIKENLITDKIIVYGNKNALIRRAGSFCGGGTGHAINCVRKGVEIDAVISSDMAHHEIKEFLDKKKCIIVLPHYVAEEYGFKKYYEKIERLVNNEAETVYFDDKRFR